MKTFFVSSTFRDMHFERDTIHKRVAPMINELSRQFGETVEFCDLRWGVNTGDLDSDEGNRKVLSVCLDEIDRCQPYMIVILGERYGWIPDQALMREAAAQRHMTQIDCLNTSVTALEIEYGALESKEKLAHTLFYFREMSGSVPPEYRAENPWYFEQLNKLKNRIIKLSGGNVRFYKAAWNEDQQTLDGMTAFADMVSEDIQKLLQAQWQSFAALSEYERDHLTQWEYARQKSRMFSARDYMVTGLKETLQSGVPLISLRGVPGSGKSMLMSRLALSLSDEYCHVVPIFCGLTALCNDAVDIVKYMIHHLQALLPLAEHPVAETETAENQQLIQKLRKLIQSFKNSAPQKKLVFFIDALDQLTESGSDGLPFITEDLGGSVQMVVSHLNTFTLKNECHVQQISALSAEEIPMVINGILQTKGLDNRVLQTILEKESSHNPLYLSLLVHRFELMEKTEYDAINRLGGNGKAISDLQILMIQNASDDLEDLCADILSIASQRIGGELIQYAAEYIAASRHGLRPSDLEKLLTAKGIAWNQIEFSMFVQYLRDFFIVLNDGRICFSHKSILSGILSRISSIHRLHQDLFAYFKSVSANDTVRMQDILYYAAKTDQKKFIIDYINDHINDKTLITCAAKTVAQLIKEDCNLWWAQLIENADEYGVVENTIVNHNYLADFINIHLLNEFAPEHRFAELHIRKANYVLAKKLIQKLQTPDSAFTLLICATHYGKLFLNTNNAEDLWQAKALFDEAVLLWDRVLGELTFDNQAPILCQAANAYRHIGLSFFQMARSSGNHKHYEEAEDAYLKGICLLEACPTESSEDWCYILASTYFALGTCYKHFHDPAYPEIEEHWLKTVELLEKITSTANEFQKAKLLTAVYVELGMFYLAEGKCHDPQKAKLYFQKNIAHYRENEYRFKEADKYGFRFNYAVALSRTAALVLNQKGSLDEAYAYAETAAALFKKLYLQDDPAAAFFHLCDSYKIFSTVCLHFGESHHPKAKAILDELLQIIRSFAEKNPGMRITEEYVDALIYYARTSLLQPEKEIEVLQAAISLLKKLFSVRKDSNYLVKIDQCNAKIASVKNGQHSQKSDADLHQAVVYFNQGNYKDAFLLFEKAALAGNAMAQSNLGVMYIRGLYVAQSTEKALYWFELAAAQGVEAAKGYIQKLKSEAVVSDNKALFDEALALYQAGRLSEALKRFTALAEQGHTMAQYIVGNMYDFGESVPKNFETAFIWYKKAAEQGHPDAQYNLGCFYADGKGTKRDYEQAIAWFRKAADSGNKDAQREVITLSRELSKMYQDVAFRAMDAQRISEALYFLEKSGKYGNSNAYYNLAVLYAQGKAVKQDIEKAMHYAKQAMSMGNMRAKQLYDLLSGM